MIRLMVADDHPVIRLGLKQILADTTDIVVAAEAEDGQEALDKILSNDFSLVLLDISMPGKNWLDIIKILKTERPALPILVFSRHSEKEFALQALKAGASGYLTKSSLVDELIIAIRKVSAGKKYISSALAEILAFEMGSKIDTREPHEILSHQEFKVMSMIVSGKSTKEIAKELSLSQTTVSTYRSRIMKQMRMKSVAELARYALQHQLVD